MKNFIPPYLLFIALVLLSSCQAAEQYLTTAWHENNTTQAMVTSSPFFKVEDTHLPRPDHSHHIALLLPLHGNFSEQAQAIYRGFLAAHYAIKKTNQSTPQITLLDTTNHQPIDQIYQKALSKGADTIVGPLTKEKLKNLLETTRISVPTLTLNSLENNGFQKFPEKLLQFSLSYIEEIKLLTQEAKNNHLHRAIIIAPNTNWGKHLAKIWINQWEDAGEKIVDQLYFNQSMPSLNKNIAKLLGITKSQKKANQIKHLLKNKNIRFLPQRRQDVDTIFLVAFPKKAREINPLLKFYYAEAIPVYAISTIYQGIKNPRYHRDLNHIKFYAMPWILEPKYLTNPLRHILTQIQQLWPDDFYKHPRLYAMGVDAYYLANHLTSLLQTQQIISGATGKLLPIANTVCRLPSLATINQGKAVTLKGSSYLSDDLCLIN